MKPTSRRHLAAAAAAAALTALGLAVPIPASAAVANPDLAISRAYVAGGVTTATAGDSLTFVFNARNNGPGPGDLAITLIWAHNVDRTAPTSSLTCVLPNGATFEPDGDNCEPGIIRPGQHPTSMVLTGVATGRDIDVKACVTNLSADAVDPVSSNNCRTLRVDLPDPLVDVTEGLIIPPEKTHVNLFVDVACKAPANGTAYLTTVVWQGTSNQPDYRQGQGQTQVLCDGVERSYSFEAVRADDFAPLVFKAGKAMAESVVTYCIQLDPDNTVCYGLGEPIRQRVRLHRL